MRIKGLDNFIKEVRDCKDFEKEKKVVNKEMNKIRSKFGKKSISGYERKKYIWKLAYANLIGYTIDFGYRKILSLVHSMKYSEKYTGYVTTSFLIPPDEEDIFGKMKSQITNDLYSKNESVQALALSLVGGTTNNQLVILLSEDILRLALGVSDQITSNTRKKALLTLLRIFRKYKDNFEHNIKNWIKPLNLMLEKYATDLSVVLAVLTLVEGIIAIRYTKHWDVIGMNVLKILYNLVVSENCPDDHKYYLIPNPWIQIKALKILSTLSINKDPQFRPILTQVLEKILNSHQVSSIKNKNNTQGAILFEAINVIIRYKRVIMLSLQRQILSLLVIFLEFNEINVKYLALEALTNVLVLPGSEEALKAQMEKILKALDDLDPSIRRRALDLLYLMCNNNNVHEIIEELLKYTEKTDIMIKEELVLKIAILAERFAANLEWYLDVIISLLANSGDYITDDIWWRCCQIVTGFGENVNSNLQKYSVGAIMHVLGGYNCSENLVNMASYILPEYGLEDQIVSPRRMFQVLHKKFDIVSKETQFMLFDAYFKIAGFIMMKGGNASDSDIQTQNEIMTLFDMYLDNLDVELQKRAFEYSQVLNQNDMDLFREIFEVLPTFDEGVEENNPLLSKMIKLLSKTSSKNDPTGINQGKELIKKKMDILKSRMENYRIERKKGNLRYEDLFIESENVDIKFYNQPLFELCRQRLALRGKNILLTPDNIKLPKSSLKELKHLLLHNNGVLYEDKQMSIQYKSQFNGGTGKAALKFIAKSGKINNLNINIASDGGLKIQLSPIKKGANDFQVMINYSNDDIIISFPVLQVFYIQNGQEKTLSLTLPVFVHKFVTPYEMDEARYMQIYNKFSTNDTYFKLDEFIKNPNTSISLNTTMKKIGSLLGGVLKMKVAAYPNMQNIQIVYATAQINRKSNDNPVVPYVIEIECFEENPDFLRLSIRSSFNPFIVHSLYQLITFFHNY